MIVFIARRRKSKVPGRKSGIALVLVLIIVTLLMIITTAFARMLVVSNATARDNESSVLAFYAADSALQLAIMRMAAAHAETPFKCDATSARVIELGELPDRPDLYGEAVVTITPVPPATNTIAISSYNSHTHVLTTPPPQLYTMTSSGYVMQVIPGKPDKLVAKRIICADVSYTNTSTSTPPPLKTKGTVTVNHWYEQNR